MSRGRVLAAVVLLAAIAGAGPKRPRYRFEVGQELRYTTEYQLTYKALLFIKETIRRSFDRRNPTLDEEFDPTEIFKPLPRNAGTARWEGRNVFDETLRCEALPRGEGLRETLDSAFDRVLGRTRTTKTTIDAARGLPVRIETREIYRDKDKGVGAASTRLVSVTRRKPGWIARLARESDLWFAKMAMLRRTGEGSDEAAVQAAHARALAVVRELRTRITIPLLKTRLDDLEREFGEAKRMSMTMTRRSARWIGKPAPDWSLEGLDGKRHTLRDYRGRVVLLDFWHDECGPAFVRCRLLSGSPRTTSDARSRCWA